MFPQGVGNVGLHFHESAMPSVMSNQQMYGDHSLASELVPVSPSNQLMYDPESPFECSRLRGSASTDSLLPAYADANTISPSVEGLEFDGEDLFNYVYAGGGSDGSAGKVIGTVQKSLCDSGLYSGMKIEDQGPTLTQLNSEDLETTLFDDFNISSAVPSDIDYSRVVPAVRNVGGTALMSFFPTSTVTTTSVVTANMNMNRYITCTSTLTSPTAPIVVRPPMNTAPVSWSPFLQMAPPKMSAVSPIVISPLPKTPATVPRNTTASSVFTFTTTTGIGRNIIFPTTSSGLSGYPQVPARGDAMPFAGPVSVKRSASPVPEITSDDVLSTIVPVLPARLQNTVPDWDEIESFLNSENEKMEAAARAANPLSPPAVKKIKCEAAEETVTSHRSPEPRPDDSSDDDSDFGNDDYSDDEDIKCDTEDFLLDFMTTGRKEKTYFWQYNTQSKGPKGKRLCKSVLDENPYNLHEFEDPVFDTNLQATSSCYRHSGKARRGDGNDVTPNPSKLFATGIELRKLGRLINAMSSPGDLPVVVRARTLREKNKYASRVCRLKKKAQHEANKIKLHGLDQEHRQLTRVLTSIRKAMVPRIKGTADPNGERLTDKLDQLVKNHLSAMVAGHTTDYVNAVLTKVAAGDRTGGLTVDD